MRVLHVQKGTGIGGSERHLLMLLPGLAERGVEVRLCVLAAKGFEDLVDPMRERGIETVTVHAGPDLNPMLIGRIRQEIARYSPDLVHTHLIHADLHGQLAARVARVPAVSSIHGTHGFYRRQPFLAAARLGGRRARRTIAISDYVGDFVRRWGLARSPEAIRVIYYGIEAGPWLLSPAERSEARRDLGLDEGAVVVGVASRLFPNKGHDVLLDAVASAAEEVPGLRLLVAGDGPLREELHRRAEGLVSAGTVRFLGFVDDVKRFMSACDVLAFPSLPAFGEGFGLAALEAMAARRPVVASGIDSLPEIVEDGTTGILVPPGVSGELAGAIVRLARDPALRDRMGRAGRERAETAFRIDPMIDRTLGVYREVVAEGRPGRA